ncbi:hypothetical protein FQA39_LY18402 [Lamprigera yunnana]|nr:hypothetical protein FQA39_LY18402 [Lamprigera yunnana]
MQYDVSTNQIVGLVQKSNSLTGFPDTFSYPAESASQIENFITSNHVSSLAYVNMAQPFNLNAPSFCLPIYGKDNKFTGDEVLLRWRTILKEAEDVGIEVLGVSSDGDSCLLKNTVHIGTKLRTRLLKYPSIMPCGNKLISLTHLNIFMKTFSKDAHGLSKNDIEPKDKMNFDVPESQATAQYLVLMSRILESDEYTLKENCITYNCYTCLELNGHTLFVIIERLRKISKEELFLPWLFSSQQYILALDILHRLKRIQLQSDVVNVCSDDSRYLMKFPKNQPKRDNVRYVQSLPDRNEINVVVLLAKDASIKDATNLGMKTTDDLQSKLPPVSISSEENYCEETLDEQRETSGFVAVTTKSGRTIILRKNSLCLLLSESSLKLSSDRSKRVKQNDTTLRNIHNEKNDKSEHPFVEKEKIQIDEWVHFSKSDVGLVLRFSYLTGKVKVKEFPKKIVPVKPPTKNTRSIRVHTL